MPTKENRVPTDVKDVMRYEQGYESFIPSEIFNQKYRE
jgi:hypothetical protein